MKKRAIMMITASVFFTFSLFFNVITASHASGATILPTTVTTPSAGCTFLGIEGK